MLNSVILIIAPLFFALIVMRSSVKVRDILTIVFVLILSIFSLLSLSSQSYLFETTLVHADNIFIVIDTLLLFYLLIKRRLCPLIELQLV